MLHASQNIGRNLYVWVTMIPYLEIWLKMHVELEGEMDCVHIPGELGTVPSRASPLATFFSTPSSEARTVGGDWSTLRFFFPAPHISARLDCWGGVGLTFLGISKNFPVRTV